ncbi:MAG: hypothetical protein R3C13_02805 [Hyphomonas sp.]
MDLDRIFRLLGKADRLLDRVIELGFVVVAAGFGGWLVWTVLDSTELGLMTKLGASLGGAAVCAILMWLFWKVGKFFV